MQDDFRGLDNLRQLLAIMARLRDPLHGCPWDRVQTFETIAPYAVEEAYEVWDAAERRDEAGLKSELGDLLLQVVFQARIAEERGLFGFADVVEAVIRKLIRRHPHVFDDQGAFLETETGDMTIEDANRLWEVRKAEERDIRDALSSSGAAEVRFETMASALPALMRALKVSRTAAAFGFDWPDRASVVAKVREEVAEVVQALDADDESAVSEEIGDLLFSVANLARHAGVDPEAALREGTAKFQRRFEGMARHLAQAGQSLAGADLPAMEAAWAAVKRSERDARATPPGA